MVPSLEGVSRNLRRAEVFHANHTQTEPGEEEKSQVEKRGQTWRKFPKQGAAMEHRSMPP